MSRRLNLFLTLLAAASLGACVVGEVDPANQPADASTTGGADAAPVVDAAPGTPDAAPTPNDRLLEFGTCMTLADWDASGMNLLAGTLAGNTPCSQCHGGGVGGLTLGADNAANFQAARILPGIRRYVDIDSITLETSSSLFIQNAGAGHSPVYTLPADRQQSILNFYNLTKAKFDAGNCQAN